jgi:hypothetical protein
VSDTLPPAGLTPVDAPGPLVHLVCLPAVDAPGPCVHLLCLPAGSALIGHSHLALTSLKLTAAGLSGGPVPRLPNTSVLVLASMLSLMGLAGQALAVMTKTLVTPPQPSVARKPDNVNTPHDLEPERHPLPRVELSRIGHHRSAVAPSSTPSGHSSRAPICKMHFL